MLEPLLEQANDVVIVEGIEDHAAVAARTDETHAAQQTQLVGNGRLAEAEQARDVAHAELGAGERIQDAHARRVAQQLEGLGEGAD